MAVTDKKKPAIKRGRMRAEQSQPDPPPPPEDDPAMAAGAPPAAPMPEADETMPDQGVPPAGGPPGDMGMPPGLGMGMGPGATLAPPPMMGGPMGGPMGGSPGGPGMGPGMGPPGGGPMDFLAALGGGPTTPPLGRMPRDAEAASSPLLDLLAGRIAPGMGGGDPYATGPMPTDLNMGDQDPNGGAQQLLSLLALGMSGAGGMPPPGPRGYQAGRSGVGEGPYGMGVAPRYGDIPNPFGGY